MLIAKCDNCKSRIYDEEKIYCEDCYEQKDEYYIKGLEDKIRELESKIKECEK
jgi:hypothetical protein